VVSTHVTTSTINSTTLDEDIKQQYSNGECYDVKDSYQHDFPKKYNEVKLAYAVNTMPA